jgi:hypothetical protein
MADENQQQPPKHFMLERDQVAAIVYNDLRERERVTFNTSTEYGRWLISSLLLVNGGALAGLFSYLDGLAQDPTTLANFAAPVWCFIVGIVFALSSGFSAWFNWSLHSHNYRLSARYDMLWDPTKWADEPRYSKAISWTYRLGIAFGVASLASGLTGAAMVLHAPFLSTLIG